MPVQPYTNMSKEDHEKYLVGLIIVQQWKYAKTYDTKAPHEYIVMEWNTDLFNAIADFITKYGWNTKYHSSDIRYGFIGNYRYWHYNTYVHDSIMNRARNVPVHMGMANYSPKLRTQYMKSGYIKGEA